MSFIKDDQLLCRLGVQEVPSQMNPLLHLQLYQLMPCVPTAFLAQRLEIHSSMYKLFIEILSVKYNWK